jgi:hypothetical protein
VASVNWQYATVGTSLFNSWDVALLFRKLAMLPLDAPVFEAVDHLRWKGPLPRFQEQCRVMGSADLFGRATSATINTLLQTA